MKAGGGSRGLGARKRHHLAVIGRQRASRVGVAGVAGDGHGLAAAAAEIDVLEGAGAARLLHPFGAAEGVERLAVEPDVEQRPILTLSNFSVLMVSAAWQGSTLPAGVMFMKPLPQPPMQGFGRLA